MAPETVEPCRRAVAFSLLGSGAWAVLAGPVAAQASTVAADTAAAARLIAAGEGQIGVTTVYDPAYVRLAFPGGDVPNERGVCTDVIVRAYRAAFGFDLQVALNADMRRAFGAYPKRWGLSAPDPNIDHRRVPNLQTYFARRGAERRLPVAGADDWQPGDIVTQLVTGGRPHIGIVSATRAPATGRLLVIHNIGRGTQREDILDALVVTGRYRFLAPA